MGGEGSGTDGKDVGVDEMKVQINEQDIPGSLQALANAINAMTERGSVATTQTTKLPATTSFELPMRYDKTNKKLEIYNPSNGAWESSPAFS